MKIFFVVCWISSYRFFFLRRELTTLHDSLCAGEIFMQISGLHIKNNPQVYTTQEGIGEIKSNPRV